MNIHQLRRYLGSSLFLAADSGGGLGSQNPPAPKGTLEEQLTAANSDLATAQGLVTSLTAERDALSAEVGTLKGQFESATQSATDAQAKVTSLTAERDALQIQHKEVSGKLTKATENVSRLEALCHVKGIDPKASVPTVPETSSTHVYDQWLSSEGAAKSVLYRQHSAEIRAEADRRAQSAK